MQLSNSDADIRIVMQLSNSDAVIRIVMKLSNSDVVTSDANYRIADAVIE